MTAGLQVWNAAGTLVFDNSYAYPQLLGYVDTGSSDGSFVITHALKAAGPLFLFQAPLALVGANPISTLSLYTISWTFSVNAITLNTGQANTRIWYGLR
jgi:hypothetical protein